MYDKNTTLETFKWFFKRECRCRLHLGSADICGDVKKVFQIPGIFCKPSDDIHSDHTPLHTPATFLQTIFEVSGHPHVRFN